MLYLSKKDNETTIEIVERTEKGVICKFINGEKAGETISYSDSTLKRWWKKLEEQEPNIVRKVGKRNSKVNRDEIVKNIQKNFDIILTQYPSTPGLYSFGDKPKRTIGITRSGITIYRKKQDSIRISYSSDYMSELKEKLFKVIRSSYVLPDVLLLYNKN